jgi:hypothetical protein
MRFILSCLLLTFLTACQTAQTSSVDLSATKFSMDKWSSRSFGNGGTYFSCPEERCGERASVTVMSATKPRSVYSDITYEQMLRLKSVNDNFIKETLSLAQTSSRWNSKIQIKSVRKINADPVGIYAEGTAEADGRNIFFAAEERVRGNRSIVAVSMAPSLRTAQNSLKLVQLPALLK